MGSVEPAVFEALNACQQDGLFAFVADSGEISGNTEFAEALDPLSNTIGNTIAAGLGSFSLKYTVRRNPVRPGGKQLGASWHVDNFKFNIHTAMLASDVLTPEFLTRQDGGETDNRLKKAWRNIIAIDAIKNAGNDDIGTIPVDRRLYKAGLQVFRPKPYALERLDGRIHRSPTNMTSEVIARTSIRVIIVPT